MTQRNPMNERYTGEKHPGNTRKSAASAKPATKAAGTVTVSSGKKTPQQKKAEAKAARREAQNRQRELDRKYYKPDTERYKKLKRLWWICLGGAIACTALSWFTSTMSAGWLPMVFLFAAYALIIFAFYIDFSKIRKERTAYQQRMAALEDKQEKKQRRRNAHNSNASKDDKSKEESSEDANAAKTEEKDVKKKRGIAGLFSGSKESKAEPSEKKA